MKVSFAWIVSFFEINQVITGEEEEEGLDDSVVTLLVSYICCGLARTQEHSSRSVAAVFLLTAITCKQLWLGGIWVTGREGNTAVGVAICFVWWSTEADSMSKVPGHFVP